MTTDIVATKFMYNMSNGHNMNMTGNLKDNLSYKIIRVKFSLFYINKNYAKVKGQELFLEPKTIKGKHTVSIPEFLYDDIMAYIDKLYGIGSNDRIFYFTKSALEKEIKRVAEKIGLPPIRVHDLRHSHASMLIEMEFEPLEIADRLGHESVKTTLDTYSHLYPEKDTKLAGELNKLRRPEPPEEEIT